MRDETNSINPQIRFTYDHFTSRRESRFEEARVALTRSMETFAAMGLIREANTVLFKLALQSVQAGRWFDGMYRI